MASNTRMKAFTAISVLAVGIFLISGIHHDIALRINHWLYDVSRAELPFHGGAIIWGDDDQIFFLAIDSENRTTNKQKEGGNYKTLYRYNIRNRNLEIFSRHVKSENVCYANGWLYFAQPKDRNPNWSTYKGYVKKNIYDGEIRPVDWAVSKNYRNKRSIRSCHVVGRPDFVGDDEAWTPLQPRVFLVHDQGMFNENLPYRIIREGGFSASLPFGSGDFWETLMQWAEWKKMFFSRQPVHSKKERRQWRDRGCLESYWFSIDGDAEKVCIPSGEWSKHNVPYIKVYKQGFVFDVKAADQDRSGVYITRGESSARIGSGHTGEPYISPDGCAVAFGRVPRADNGAGSSSGKMEVVTAELCQ